MIDTSQNPSFLKFASEMVSEGHFGEDSKTIAFYEDSWLAVVVYHGKSSGNINISIATTSPKWCSKKALRVIFAYPFNQLGVNRVTALIRKTNRKSRSLVERLGFRLEGTLKQYFKNGEAAMVYGLLKDENRWCYG